MPEAGALFGLSPASSYFAAAKGRLPTIKMGDRLFVPRAALQRMLDTAGAVDRELQRRGESVTKLQ